MVYIARKLEGLGSEVLQIACKLEAGALKCCKPGAWPWGPIPLGGEGGLSNREPEIYIYIYTHTYIYIYIPTYIYVYIYI